MNSHHGPTIFIIFKTLALLLLVFLLWGISSCDLSAPSEQSDQTDETDGTEQTDDSDTTDPTDETSLQDDGGASLEETGYVVTENYLSRGYQGFGAYTDTGTARVSSSFTDEIEVSQPSGGGFTCDGYFMLEGSNSLTDSQQYCYVRITPLFAPWGLGAGEEEVEEAFLFVRGSFATPVWLPFGPGEYTVDVCWMDISDESENSITDPYDGDIYKWSYQVLYQFSVTNTRNEDGRFLYPSGWVQADADILYAKALELTAGAGNGEEKVRRIHDWVIGRLEYDFDSTVEGQRKKQDALSSWNSRLGVCEGYTGLAAALLRASGIRTKCVAGTGITPDGSDAHAWNEVYLDGVWYLLDATWDDQERIQFRDDYFLLPDLTGIDGDHVKLDERTGRALLF